MIGLPVRSAAFPCTLYGALLIPILATVSSSKHSGVLIAGKKSSVAPIKKVIRTSKSMGATDVIPLQSHLSWGSCIFQRAGFITSDLSGFTVELLPPRLRSWFPFQCLLTYATPSGSWSAITNFFGGSSLACVKPTKSLNEGFAATKNLQRYCTGWIIRAII